MSLGTPFVVRAAVLAVMFVVAFVMMHDVGFTPEPGGRPLAEMRQIATASIDHGWRVPAVKWLMVQSLFTGGVGIYGFYALQPYLLELYGDPEAYQIAGLSAAIVAGAQILGGLAAPRIRGRFQKRTSALLITATLSSITMALVGVFEHFWAVIGLTVVWALLFAASIADPPGVHERADPLAPARDDPLVRLADVLHRRRLGAARARPRRRRLGLRVELPARAVISAFALPFIYLSRRQNATADVVTETGDGSRGAARAQTLRPRRPHPGDPPASPAANAGRGRAGRTPRPDRRPAPGTPSRGTTESSTEPRPPGASSAATPASTASSCPSTPRSSEPQGKWTVSASAAPSKGYGGCSAAATANSAFGSFARRDASRIPAALASSPMTSVSGCAAAAAST